MTGPLSITARITVAWDEVRDARHHGDHQRERAWAGLVDRLLDQHLKLLQANGQFKTLAVLDPALDKRLTVKPGIKLIGRIPK